MALPGAHHAPFSSLAWWGGWQEGRKDGTSPSELLGRILPGPPGPSAAWTWGTPCCAHLGAPGTPGQADILPPTSPAWCQAPPCPEGPCRHLGGDCEGGGQACSAFQEFPEGWGPSKRKGRLGGQPLSPLREAVGSWRLPRDHLQAELSPRRRPLRGLQLARGALPLPHLGSRGLRPPGAQRPCGMPGQYPGLCPGWVFPEPTRLHPSILPGRGVGEGRGGGRGGLQAPASFASFHLGSL